VVAAEDLKERQAEEEEEEVSGGRL